MSLRLFAFLLLGAIAPAHAGFVAAPLRGAAVTIDGSLGDPAWADVPANEVFHQFEPEDGRPAPVRYRTSVRVLASLDALTFAIRAWTPPGEPVGGALARRDKVARDQDFVGI
jgi:hypothetical protein